MRNIIAIISILVSVSVLLFVVLTNDNENVGSIIQSQEYVATSTAQNTVYGAFSNDRTIKSGRGSLGSVIVTGANTGILNFYDATTTDITARTGNKATTSLLMLSIPASLAAGTYVFDIGFNDGLMLELESGNMPTTTITYR